MSEYEDYTDAVRQLGRFLDEVYMHKRIHSSLGYLTPVEFEQHWLTQHTGQPQVSHPSIDYVYVWLCPAFWFFRAFRADFATLVRRIRRREMFSVVTSSL